RRIPYGSKIILPDATLTAVDTGGHVRSRRAARRIGRSKAERNAIVIDRFFETKRQALAWAKKHPHFMTVRVISPNESKTPAIVTKTLAPTAGNRLAYNSSSQALQTTEANTRLAAAPASVAERSATRLR
ncbi:MAG TPA: hypothetical protein VF551_08425, partial [Chthoniobacterales bacterium]